MSKVAAYASLGYHVAKTLLRLSLGESRGMEEFLENYRDDRLPPLNAEERALLSSVDGCLACGLCDTIVTANGRSARAEFNGPSALPLSYSRHPPDYDALDSYLSRFESEDLDRASRLCPARIPLRRLAQLVRDVALRTRS